MIKTLQKRFVITAMAAISILLIFLLGAINITHYTIVNRQIDTVMTVITDSKGAYDPKNFGNQPGGQPLPPQPMPYAFKPDDVMGARFFMVIFDAENNIAFTDVNNIYAVSANDATQIAQELLLKGKDSGTYKQFKYQINKAPNNSGTIITFMDISIQQNSIWAVLLASCAGGAVCWLIMLLVVILLAKRAINPIAQNIDKQKQFVTNAGHELKTPLAIILANTDAMELHSGENKWSRNIRTQAQRLSSLMQNMLTLARMDEYGTKLPMSTFSFNILLEETLDYYHEPTESKNLDIQTNIKPDISICANRDSIMQMLSVLLDNAVQYSPANSTIDIDLNQSNKTVSLSISNICEQAPGRDMQQLFDRFYRGNSARTQKTGGFGIGLSAAQTIAAAHKGSIKAHYNEATKLITFTVTLQA